MIRRLQFSKRQTYIQRLRGKCAAGLLIVLPLALPAWPQAPVMPSRGDPEVLHMYLRQVHREVERLKQPDAAIAATPLDART